MELRVLRYFMTIAREGSITSAANVLHVTQPTLSRQIRDLENELGQKLRSAEIFISAAEKPRRFSILQKLQRRYGKTIPASIIICTAETRKT